MTHALENEVLSGFIIRLWPVKERAYAILIHAIILVSKATLQFALFLTRSRFVPMSSMHESEGARQTEREREKERRRRRERHFVEYPWREPTYREAHCVEHMVMAFSFSEHAGRNDLYGFRGRR